MTWTGHLYPTAVQLPVVKWLVCMRGELLYQSINLCKTTKVLSDNKVILWSGSGMSRDFWKQEWVRIRTSVQATSVSPCRGPQLTLTHVMWHSALEKNLFGQQSPVLSASCAEGTVFQRVQELTWFLLEQTPGWCVLLSREVLVICRENKPPDTVLSPWQRSESLSFSLTQPHKK